MGWCSREDEVCGHPHTHPSHPSHPSLTPSHPSLTLEHTPVGSLVTVGAQESEVCLADWHIVRRGVLHGWMHEMAKGMEAGRGACDDEGWARAAGELQTRERCRRSSAEAKG